MGVIEVQQQKGWVCRGSVPQKWQAKVKTYQLGQTRRSIGDAKTQPGLMNSLPIIALAVTKTHFLGGFFPAIYNCTTLVLKWRIATIRPIFNTKSHPPPKVTMISCCVQS